MKTTKRKREPAAAVAAAAPPPEKKGKAAPAPVIALASNCNVKDAAELKKSLCKLADENAAVGIDVKSLERIDTATMQLLCAFVRDRTTRALRVEWLGESPALQEAARLLGVGELLALPPQPDTKTLGAAA